MPYKVIVLPIANCPLSVPIVNAFIGAFERHKLACGLIGFVVELLFSPPPSDITCLNKLLV